MFGIGGECREQGWFLLAAHFCPKTGSHFLECALEEFFLDRLFDRRIRHDPHELNGDTVFEMANDAGAELTQMYP